ncbi:MAG TPA: hypothetical protein VGN83_20945 [Falsiroseomonas sp.]|jgi:hypothetical protein|nr:hypothetical protein [Falsiroseomonas sp.]
MSAASDLPAILAEADALADRTLVAEAERAVESVKARLAEAEAEAVQARRAIAAAVTALAELASGAARGPMAAAATVAKAETRIRDAEAFARYLGAVERTRREVLAEAEAVLREAKAAAWLPVLRRGQELRIGCGIRCDEARRVRAGLSVSATPPAIIEEAEQRKRAEFDAAKPLWLAATEVIRHALRNGARLPEGAAWVPGEWPTSEAAERRHWRLPLAGSATDVAA